MVPPKQRCEVFSNWGLLDEMHWNTYLPPGQSLKSFPVVRSLNFQCHIKKILWCLVKSEHYCPFLLFQVGLHEAAMRRLKIFSGNIKSFLICWRDRECRWCGVLLYLLGWRVGHGKKEENTADEGWSVWITPVSAFSSVMSDTPLEDWARCRMGCSWPGGAVVVVGSELAGKQHSEL